MIGDGVLLFCVVMTILIAQFSPLVALFVSIGLCACEVGYLYINQEDIVNV